MFKKFDIVIEFGPDEPNLFALFQKKCLILKIFLSPLSNDDQLALPAWLLPITTNSRKTSKPDRKQPTPGPSINNSFIRQNLQKMAPLTVFNQGSKTDSITPIHGPEQRIALLPITGSACSATPESICEE
ncbi:MAG: hypothetical protein KZQ88_06965 [Candidatus Thiodiazotropha sp. (ex Dulcina madagascariensis)]|nr:hypothetical protein [Candidatus Thiodiazotropha sp. (ex Dulcina madagascariensis)]MCU7925476.1 hypothetical protein [Candidatus Thiodiazotropha sp. (ex Dulcina madagascariensis)]